MCAPTHDTVNLRFLARNGKRTISIGHSKLCCLLCQVFGLAAVGLKIDHLPFAVGIDRVSHIVAG